MCYKLSFYVFLSFPSFYESRSSLFLNRRLVRRERRSAVSEKIVSWKGIGEWSRWTWSQLRCWLKKKKIFNNLIRGGQRHAGRIPPPRFDGFNYATSLCTLGTLRCSTLLLIDCLLFTMRKKRGVAWSGRTQIGQRPEFHWTSDRKVSQV